MPTPIIWPLMAKLQQPLFMQQRTKANCGLLAPKIPVNLPWNVVSSRVGVADKLPPFPTVVHEMMPIAITQYGFIGITRDNVGAPLGGVTVKLYRESDDFMVETTVSDANGNYRFTSAPPVGATYYTREFLAGAPNRAGTSDNGLVPS